MEIKKKEKKKFFSLVSSLLTKVDFGDEWFLGLGQGRGCLFFGFFPSVSVNQKEMAHASLFDL